MFAEISKPNLLRRLTMTKMQIPATADDAADHDPFRDATEAAHRARAETLRQGLAVIGKAARNRFSAFKA
jgi:hypothetical protein